MGWKGKTLGGLFGGVPGAIIGDALEQAQDTNRQRRFAERQSSRGTAIGSQCFTVAGGTLCFDAFVQTGENVVLPVFPSGTRVPCKKTLRLFTTENKPLILEIALFEGSAAQSEDSKLIVNLRIAGARLTSSQTPILVTVGVDKRGVLSCTAKEETGRKELQVVRSVSV